MVNALVANGEPCGPYHAGTISTILIGGDSYVIDCDPALLAAILGAASTARALDEGLKIGEEDVDMIVRVLAEVPNLDRGAGLSACRRVLQARSQLNERIAAVQLLTRNRPQAGSSIFEADNKAE